MQKQEKIKSVVRKAGETGKSHRGEHKKGKKFQEVKKRHCSHNHRDG